MDGSLCLRGRSFQDCGLVRRVRNVFVPESDRPPVTNVIADRQRERREGDREMRNAERVQREAPYLWHLLLRPHDRCRNDGHTMADGELDMTHAPLGELVATSKRLGNARYAFGKDEQELSALEETPHVRARSAHGSGARRDTSDER